MQAEKSKAPQEQNPDFLEHLRERLGTTRGEAEQRLTDWVAEYPRAKGSGTEKPGPR